MNNVYYNIGGLTDNAVYPYVPNSDLLLGLATTGGRSTTYGYEPNRNLKTLVENKTGQTVISRYDYTYDEVGRRKSVDASGIEIIKAINARVLEQWFLNAQATPEGIALTPDAREYTYDPIGNRKTAQTPTAETYVANNVNQYATVNAQALAYDYDGNLTEDANKRYTYDGENRLIAVEPKTPAEGDKKATFAYDYMGRRIKKESYAYQSNAWVKTDETKYLYDGWNMIRELDASGAAKNSYVWGIDLSGTLQGAGGVGGLIASADATTRTNYYHDANGNVTELAESPTGKVTAHYEYDPFGNVTYSHGSKAAANPYRFSTKYHDDETALVYYGYRYYTPTLGRWVNRDPIEERGGVNLYGFVGNNGIDRNDPLGLFSLGDLIPDFALTPGIGISATYMQPFLPPLGPYAGIVINANSLARIGSCCDNGRKRNYLKWDGSASIGIYAGKYQPPNIRLIKPLVSNLAQCPIPESLRCSGGLKINVTSGIFYISCFFDFLSSRWSCASGISIGGSNIWGDYRVSVSGMGTCSETILN